MQRTWEHRPLIVNRAKWRQSTSHLPLQILLQAGFLFLLSAVSSFSGCSTAQSSPAWRDKTPAAFWLLWLYSLLLAMLQGGSAISQPQVCVVCWLSYACKCSRRADSPSESFSWHEKVLPNHTWLGTVQPGTVEVRHGCR